MSDATAISATNLSRRKGRTVLTVVGVVIGVAALVLMVSLAIGLEREVLKLFQSEDVLRTIYIMREKSVTGRARPLGLFDFGMGAIPVTERDLDEVRKLPGVALVTPDLRLLLTIEIEGEPGSEEHFVPVGGLPAGEEAWLRRFLVAGDVWKEPGERAVVIPSRILAMRFQRKPGEVVGKRIVFSRAYRQPDDPEPEPADVTYTIVGVADAEKLGLKARQLFLPMQRAQELRDLTVGGNAPMMTYKKGTYLLAEVKAADVRTIDDLKRQLANAGYQALTTADIMGTIGTIFLVIEGFMACIGAIGLLVSIFGIANTMAMAVLERTREIGIMKAIGARNGDIRRIFLMEAAAIGLVGGLIGLAAGTAGGALLNLLAHQATEIPPEVRLFHVSLWLAAGALLFSMLVSVLAGLAPAVRAARLDPVQALRYE